MFCGKITRSRFRLRMLKLCIYTKKESKIKKEKNEFIYLALINVAGKQLGVTRTVCPLSTVCALAQQSRVDVQTVQRALYIICSHSDFIGLVRLSSGGFIMEVREVFQIQGNCIYRICIVNFLKSSKCCKYF